jgi:hypothetical protein
LDKPTAIASREAFMPAKPFLAIALALSLLLFAPAQPANAASPSDPYAYQELVTGFDFALDAYQADPSDPNAFAAAVYGEDAEYYASVAFGSDDRNAWYSAHLCGSYAADYALASYEATGDVFSAYAYAYFSSGPTYALSAYMTFA